LAQYDINLREYWRILKKRKAIVILTALILGTFSTAFAFLRAPAPIYSSVCSIRFERETTVEGLYAKTLSWGSGDDLETQMSVIQSYPVFEKVAEKLRRIPSRDIGIKDHALKQNAIRIIEDLQSKVTVERENFANIINILVTDRDPLLTQRLANTIALTYKEMHSQQQMKRTTEALKYIRDQLREVRQKLRESEEEFNRFSQANQIISIDMQSENLLARAQELQNNIQKLGETRRGLTALSNRLDRFIEKPEVADANFYSPAAGKQYQAANDKVVELTLKRETLLQDFTSRHPEVIAADRRIAEVARKMAMLLKIEMKMAQTKEGDLNGQLSQIEQKTNSLMEKKLEYDRLKRKVELYTNMTSLLEQKNQEALIRKAEKPEEVTIVKPALTPTSPINPPKTATTGAMGVVIGLVLGLVAAFIVETFDTSLGAIEDVEETLGSQVLGVVPHADAKELIETLEKTLPQGKESSSVMQTAYLVSHSFPKSMISESFRALRTNIQFRDAESQTRAIALTSASPQEGKTMVSVNLAITMAQAGMKTLLVGSDMRKPMLARAFGVEITPGLTDILLGNYAWRDTVKTITDLIMGKMSLDEVMMTPGLDNLHLITAGSIPPNPAVLIESKRLIEFVDEAKEEYDLILFDSPPILSTADAAILGSKMDGVLLVYRVGSVSRGLLKRATTQLEQAKCNFMGVVLNGMRPEISPDFQDFKYYKYYYSYSEQDEKGRKGKGWLGLLPLFTGKDRSRGKEGQTSPPDKKRRRTRDREGTKYRFLKISLLFIALAFLAAGLLWQNGIIDPLKLLGAEGPNKGHIKKPDPGKMDSFKKKQNVPAVKATKTLPKPARQPEKEIPAPVLKPPRPAATTPTEEKSESSVKLTKTAPGPTKGTGGQGAKAPPAATAGIPGEEKSPGEPVPVAETAPQPYSLYLGSFKTLKRAETAFRVQSRKGLAPYWTRVKFKDKGEWYRLFIGHFKAPREAEAFLLEHGLKDAKVKKTAFGNLVGVYPSDSSALEDQKHALKDHGFSPYILTGPGGNSRLMVGAYVTREGAEYQRGLLQSKGLQSQIVDR